MSGPNSSSSFSEVKVPYAPFTVFSYIQRYASFLDAQRFAIMSADGDRFRVHDSRHGVERFTVIGTWLKR